MLYNMSSMISLFWNHVTPWLVALICLVILLYKFFTKHQNFWEKQGLPVAKKHPLFGSFNVMFLKPLHVEDEENHRTLGNLYGRYDGQTPILAITEPEILKDIMVKDFNIFPNRRHLQFGDEVIDNNVGMLEGEDWKRVRSILTNTSTSSKLRKMIPLIENCIQSLYENILEAVKIGHSIDITRLFSAFAMDIIATCAFGTKLNSHKDPNNPFVAHANVLLNSKMSWRIYMTVLFPQIMKFFNISLFNPKATRFFKQFVEEVMDRRKKSGEVRFDFVQLIMDAEKDESSDENMSNAELEDLKILKKKKLSQIEAVSQCCGFFIAGYSSTSSILSSVFYNLATNLHCQKQLREEIENVIGKTQETLDYETINEMKYLDAVIAETIRMYPAGLRIERQAVTDYKLRESGIEIKKGMVISIPVYALHNDPKWYPEPKKFDPERFLEQEKSKRHPYAYLGFGMGPRACVGMRFALMIIKLCIIRLLQKYQFKPGAKLAIPPELDSSGALMTIKNVILDIEERKEDISSNGI
uniref:Cytochrome P450 3A8 n=1 Tax=Hadrurus spadix TaxID=141984 RepID=A0A1W7RAR8_9SCOR